MKSIYPFITLFLCFISIGTLAQEKTYLSNAVNIAGKQRMLGQRMAKNKVYLAANKKTDYAKKELEEALFNFEKGIIILNDFAPTRNPCSLWRAHSFMVPTAAKQVSSAWRVMLS